MRTSLKITSVLIIITFVFPLSARAEDRFLRTKTVGKLTMIAILSAIAFVVKMLVDKDRKEVARLHERFGVPDRSIEFQEGFDRWRVEWYGNHVYIFRNGVLYRSLKSFKSSKSLKSSNGFDDFDDFNDFNGSKVRNNASL